MTYDPTSALGRRGERPVFFRCRLPWESKRELISIPGIALAPGGLRCTWDIAPVLAQMLGVSSPVPPLEANVDLLADVRAMPGLQEYTRLGLRDQLRPYQREGALFLARRSWAMNCDPMRSGKSVQSLAASILVGAQHVLIVCPALAKYVWADEIHKWLGYEALILEGRAGTHARQYCGTCGARGFLVENESISKCPDCLLANGQANGYRIARVRKLKEKKDTTITESGTAQTTIVYTCPRHPEVVDSDPSSEGAPCAACRSELKQTILTTRYIIVNYDLLVSQKAADMTGVTFTRDDLQGWAPVLAEHNFDLCIADESHLLRGWSSDPKKAGQTRRERFAQVVEHFARVWGLTGTPIYGFTRDLWGQLDAISNGLFSDRKGLPFNFHARYCDGHKDDYGWRANGRSALADTELKDRLEYFKMQRPRSKILKDMPPKVRQIIRLDEDEKTRRAMRSAASAGVNEGKLMRLLKQTSVSKRSAVVENILNEIAAGEKCVVFTLLRDSAQQLGKAIETATRRTDLRTRMKEVDARVWTTHGDASPKARFELAKKFREHTGAGVFIATIDSVQVAVSLKGASSVHFADLHWQPSAMLQAEDRPYEVGVTGLSIVYYIVKGSVDEHVEAVVLPKVETLAQIVDEQGADEMKKAFSGPDESMNEIYARMSAHLKAEDKAKAEAISHEPDWDEEF